MSLLPPDSSEAPATPTLTGPGYDALPHTPFTPPGPHPAHRVFFGPEGLRAGWSLLLFGLIAAALGYGLTTLLHHLHPTSPHRAGTPLTAVPALIGEYLSFAVLALAALAMTFIERRPFRSYGLGATPHAASQFIRGLLWGLFFLTLLVLALDETHLLTFQGLLLHGSAALAQGALWFLVFLGVGFAEEFTLRGYVQFTLARGLGGLLRSTTHTRLASTIGFWAAALFFSFIFGFGHKNNAGESPIGLLSAGLIGLVFCLSLWRTGSLWWAIGFHAAWDWTQSFLFGVADSGMLIQNHLLASHPEGRPILSGGLTGPEGSAYILLIVALIATAILLTLRRRHWPLPGSRVDPDLPSTPALDVAPPPDLA